MTNQPIGQPMTRRERRALEEQGIVPPTPEPIQTSVAEAPQAEFVEPPAPSAPLPSRRELRLLQQGGAPADYERESEPPGAAPTEALVTTPAPTPPVVPLPPVFGAPVSVPATTGTTTVTPFSDAVPVISPSRTVGQMATTTSSLIIPETPTIDIAGPLGHTGEVVVTGQIRLPQTLSEIGSLPALVEDRDDDEVMDAYVTGAIAMSAKPMRASQAVSGKGDDSDIVLVRRARWGTAAVVTSLGAAVLGLAAVALLILAVMTDVLG